MGSPSEESKAQSVPESKKKITAFAVKARSHSGPFFKTEIVVAKIDENGKITKQIIPAPDTKVANKIFINAYTAVPLSKNTYSFVANIPKTDSYRIGLFEIK